MSCLVVVLRGRFILQRIFFIFETFNLDYELILWPSSHGTSFNKENQENLRHVSQSNINLIRDTETVDELKVFSDLFNEYFLITIVPVFRKLINA